MNLCRCFPQVTQCETSAGVIITEDGIIESIQMLDCEFPERCPEGLVEKDLIGTLLFWIYL